LVGKFGRNLNFTFRLFCGIVQFQNVYRKTPIIVRKIACRASGIVETVRKLEIYIIEVKGLTDF